MQNSFLGKIKLLLAFTLIGSLIGFIVPKTTAAVTQPTAPTTITYQGRLNNNTGSAVTTGSYTFKFRIYNASTGGTLLWGPETHTLAVQNGIFSASLGSIVSFASAGLDFNSSPYYLTLEVNNDGEMSPRQPIEATPFAIHSGTTFGTFTASADPSTPYAGALYYNTTANTLYVSDGTSWNNLSLSGNAFVQGGNALGTTAIFGTTDSNSLRIQSALAAGGTTTEAIRVASTNTLGSSDELFQIQNNGTNLATMLGNGNLGIGTVSPTAKLHVSGDLIVSNGTNLSIENPSYSGLSSGVLSSGGGFHTVINGRVTGSDGGTGQLVIGGSITADTSGSNFNTVVGPGFVTSFSGAGANNTVIGYSANLTGTTNSTAIGYGATVSASNAMALGNSSTRVAVGGDTTPDYRIEIQGSSGSGYLAVTNSTDGDILSIDSTGRVGIGTANPSAKLSIEDLATHAQATIKSGSGVSSLLLTSYRNSNVTHSAVEGEAARGTSSAPLSVQSGDPLMSLRGSGWDGSSFYSPGSDYSASVELQADENFTSTLNRGGRITFKTLSTGTNFMGTRAVITSAGNFGIGTTTPGRTLDVANSDDYQVRLGANAANSYDIGRNASNGYMLFSANTAADQGFKFTGANGDYLILNNNANLGSGNARVQVVGSTSDNTARAFQVLSGSYAKLLTVTNDGNVGIGDTSPDFKLELEGTSSVTDRKIGINDTQVVYLPDQAAFTGSLFYGNGGTALSHTAGTEGYYNTGIGLTTMVNNTTGADNTAVGAYTLRLNTTGSYNTAIGFGSIESNTTGQGNTGLGQQTLGSNSTGSFNTATGLQSLFSNTTASNNTATGYQSLFANTTGSGNSAFGLSALVANTTGNNNTAFGSNSMLSNTTGSTNTAFGSNALRINTTGEKNIAVGGGALFSNTTAFSNVAVGVDALHSNTTGGFNVAIGEDSLYYNSTGGNNTALGYRAGYYITDGVTANTTGSSSLFLGYDTRAAADGQTNQIVIGTSAIGNGSNSVTLGNTSITKTILQGNVGIGTTSPGAKLDISGTSSTLGVKVTSNVASDILFYGAGTVTGDINLFSDNISATGSLTGEIRNYNTTSATANAVSVLNVGGASAGDPYTNYCISGVSCMSVGVDNSDSDKLKFSTGGPGSGDLMTLTTAGNLGIGTTSPGTLLNVQSNATVGQEIARFVGDPSTGHGHISIRNAGAGNGSGSVYFDSFTGTNRASVGYVESSSYAFLQTAGADPILFNTNSTERMRLTDAGNLGIGTTNPGAKLEVTTTSGDVAYFGIGSYTGKIGLDGTGMYFNHNSATRNLSFGVNGARDNLVIATTGNIGLGTTSPADLVHAYKDANGYVGIQVNNPNTGSSARAGLYAVSDSGTTVVESASSTFSAVPSWMNSGVLRTSQPSLVISAYNGGVVKFQSGGVTDRMTLDTSGNVGIGTTTPGYKLEVSTDSAAKPSTNTWTIASDERLKKNITNFTDGLNTLLGIQPRTYQYNGRGGVGFNDTDTHIGIIAQELEPVAPYMVGKFEGSLDGVKTELLNYQGHALPFILTNSIKELANQTIYFPTNVFSDSKLEPGEVVYIVSGSQPVKVNKTDREYNNSVTAVIERAYDNSELGKTPNGYMYKLRVAGTAKLYVSDENGVPKVGDYVATSKSSPGKVMKATKPGYVFGQVISLCGSDCIEVKIEHKYFTPSLATYLQLAGMDAADFSEFNQDNTIVLGSTVIDGSLMVTGGIRVNGKIVAGTIEAKQELKSGERVCINSNCVTEEDILFLKQLRASQTSSSSTQVAPPASPEPVTTDDSEPETTNP